MGWRWLAILFGIFLIGICLWSIQTVEPFQSKASSLDSNSYSFEDVSGEIMKRDISTNTKHVDRVFSFQAVFMQGRILNVLSKITEFKEELHGYRCHGILCVDRCVSQLTTGELSAKGPRCNELIGFISNAEKLIETITNTIPTIHDTQQNWIDMLNEGSLNFMNDYRDVSESIPTVPIRGPYESSSSIDMTDLIGDEAKMKAALSTLNFVPSVKGSILYLANSLTTFASGRGVSTATSQSALVGGRYVTNAIILEKAAQIRRDLEYHYEYDKGVYTRVALNLNRARDILNSNAPFFNLLSDGKPYIKNINELINNASEIQQLARRPTGGMYARPMPVLGTLTSKNQEELSANAALVKKIWLMVPNNLEQYIYVNPENMKAYMRPLTLLAPYTADMRCKPIYTASSDRSTYTLIDSANRFNLSYCNNEITPDTLSLLPVPTQTFITSYVQSRRMRISEITIRSNKDYQAAATAFQKYQTDLSGLSLKILASPIKDKINGSSMISGYGGSTKKNIYLVRMILENKFDILAVPSTDTNYINANAAYTKYKEDLAKSSNLGTTPVEGLVSIYLKTGSDLEKSLFSAMILSSTAAVNTVDTADSDFKAAQTSLIQYRKDLAGNVSLKAESNSQKVSKYVGGNNAITKAYFTVILHLNNTDISLIKTTSADYIDAKNAFRAYGLVPTDTPLTVEQKMTKYIPTGSAIAQAIFVLFVGSTDTEKVSFNLPPPIKPTQYFTNTGNLYSQAKIYDQIAQSFYEFGDGTTSMIYIYDIFPVGSSILDVRFDLKTNIPRAGAVEQMQALTAAYKQKLVQNLSVNQRYKLISNFQTAYTKIRDEIADASGTVIAGATMRFFYTMTSGKIKINGMARDQIAAGSFYTEYNCGIETPTGYSPGKIGYSPITYYTKNASDPLDCTDKATLIQIGIDYVNALNYDMKHVLRTVSNPWNQNSNLYVTKILGFKQLSPLSCNLQWEETSFDYYSNKILSTAVRNVYVPYIQNSSYWFATETFLDVSSVSGFKYLNTAPELTMLNPPIVLPPPYIDDAKLNDGGICPKASCSDPAVLYKMIDDYNAYVNPGVILSVVKATTMNSGQCDLLVDIDYGVRGNPKDDKLKGTRREQISIYLDLNIPTCTYDFLGSEIGYGIQDETPLLTDASGKSEPFDYLFTFGVNTFTTISKAANSVKDQINSVYELAKSTLTTYRESTFANLGNMRSFDGCPQIQCHSIDIMSDIFHKYDRDNKFTKRMGKIIQVGASSKTTCDVLFENQPIIGWNDASGLPVYGATTTAAARFMFIPDSASAYDTIFDNQIAALRAIGGKDNEIKDIEDQKKAINTEVSCSFMTVAYIDILPSKPTPWTNVTDMSNSLPTINPSKSDIKDFPDMFPFPNPFPSMTVNCKDYKIINAIRAASIETRNVKAATDVIGYTIDSSVPGTLTVTDVTARNGSVSMNPNTLVYSKNSDNQTCAVEMIMDGGYKVHRSFMFDLDNKLQYNMKNLLTNGTMPVNADTKLSYREFRDICDSKIYNEIAANEPFSLTDPVHTYSYSSAPRPLNLSISRPLPLVVDPVCNLNMNDLTVITAALSYNGYPKPYQVTTFPPALTDLSRSYEVRITSNEYLPFGTTYKIVSFYTSDCNPIVNSFQPSNPMVSQLAKRVGNFNNPENIAALRDYINTRFVNYVSDARPKRKLGRIWEGGFDTTSQLYIYAVTMGEYDADGNTMNFYGYPQNDYDPNIIPRAYIACEFRKRFLNPTVTYLANMFVMTSRPRSITMAIVVDPSPVRLDDPFLSMTVYKHLEFTPLAVRDVPGRPNQRVQLTRLEFYSGNALQNLTGSLNGDILAPGDVALRSITGFGDIFKSDGHTVEIGAQNCFVCMIGTPIRAYSARALKIDGLSFMSGRDPAFDVVQWKLRGSINGKFWKNLYTSPRLDYPAYGFWRVPMISFRDMSVPLPQNPTRLKGFKECGAAVNTIDIVNRLSDFIYTTYSSSYFPGAYTELQKNTSRVYLRDLSDMLVDDFNNTVYVRAKVESLDNKYNLRMSSVNFVMTFTRRKTCVQALDYSITTTPDMRASLLSNYAASQYADNASHNALKSVIDAEYALSLREAELVAAQGVEDDAQAMTLTSTAINVSSNYNALLSAKAATNAAKAAVNTAKNAIEAAKAAVEAAAAAAATAMAAVLPPFTPITVTKKPTETLPFAYGAYPSALTKYKSSSISLEPVPPYTVTTFLSNGPDRPASIRLSQALTDYSDMAAEGAAQMCQDNLACIGFSVNTDGMSGSFISTPTSATTIVDSAGIGNSAFFLKTGFNLVAYVRFRGMGGSPSLSKVAFYKGNTLAPFTLNAGNSYAINAMGAQTGTTEIGWELANLVDYKTTTGWKATNVDGFMLRFQTPLIFDGYTFVTTSLPTIYDPKSWIMETSMNGRDWLKFDERRVTPPAARFAAYPIFRPSNDSGVSTDFTAKTLMTCNISCASLLPKMTELYLTQTNNSRGNFFVDLIGHDIPGNQCLLGWDDAAGRPHVTGFVFKPVFGDCSNISVASNITIKRELTATGLSRLPDTGQFLSVRFKPTALNGSTGISLAFIGFLYKGTLLEPDSAVNTTATGDEQNAYKVIDTTLTNQWSYSSMGILVFNFKTLSSADSFTMIAGSDATRAPVAWVLESSPDGIVWSVLHEQKSNVVAPAAGRQYPIYSFDGTVQIPIKGVLDKTIQDAGYTCASTEIINGDVGTVPLGVNDAAFNRSIFFNPLSYTYDNIRNQCNYLQGSNGTTLTVTFSTIKSRNTSASKSGYITTVTDVKTSSAPLVGTPIPFTSGLRGLADCSPREPYGCDVSDLLTAMDLSYQQAPINAVKAPLRAVASGYNRSRNECLFELDDMYAPLNSNGAPVRQIGFQIKKNMGCTVPGAQALIINTAVPTGDILTRPSAPSGPYTFIRFKVAAGGLKIGAFEFFKGGVAKPYTATVTNPTGSQSRNSIDIVNSNLTSYADSAVKPIEFKFKPPLDFDGYSWTTLDRGGVDPIKWILQTSTNGYIWVDIDSREDTSAKSGNFKMPIYGLNGSSTVRDIAVAKTYSLKERGIECGTLKDMARDAIAASDNFKKIAEDNFFEPTFTIISSENTLDNACTFKFEFTEDNNKEDYTAVITYVKKTSITDKSATIDTITFYNP